MLKMMQKNVKWMPLKQILARASGQALDLITNLLVWDPTRRPLAESCLKHPYFDPLLSTLPASFSSDQTHIHTKSSATIPSSTTRKAPDLVLPAIQDNRPLVTQQQQQQSSPTKLASKLHTSLCNALFYLS